MNAAQNVTTLADLGDREFATLPETAAILGFDPRTVSRAIESGKIPATRVARTYRVPVAWLREQVAGVTVPSLDEEGGR